MLPEEHKYGMAGEVILSSRLVLPCKTGSLAGQQVKAFCKDMYLAMEAIVGPVIIVEGVALGLLMPR